MDMSATVMVTLQWRDTRDLIKSGVVKSMSRHVTAVAVVSSWSATVLKWLDRSGQEIFY
jgi:hypothetical protein